MATGTVTLGASGLPLPRQLRAFYREAMLGEPERASSDCGMWILFRGGLGRRAPGG